ARPGRARRRHHGTPGRRCAASPVRFHNRPAHRCRRRTNGDRCRMIPATRRFLLGAAGALATPDILRAQGTREISFYFPVAVGGPITKIIDGYAADFMRENPTIKVTPIYAGTYQETLTKAQTALKAGSGPQLAVLLSTDVFSLIDDDLI